VSLWIDDALVVARRDPGTERASLIEVDRRALAERLLAEVADLLPDAELVPPAAAADDRQLAALPLALLPGERLPDFSPPPHIRTRSLAVGAALAIAVVALLALAVGTLRLARRRSAFVAAVTHELRTPLTTLRLYGDLLDRDLMPEAERAAAITTMREEADRLAVMVDNVLAFARLEGHSQALEEHALGDLLAEQRERLAARLAAAGLELDWQVAEGPGPTMRLDPAALTHILHNLVDNAAKYASDGDPPRVAVELAVSARTATLRVCDHGPGVPAAARAGLFTAFRRGADHAQPGIGLGLALCRELARRMHSRLAYEARDRGACFALELPRVR